jgi:ketosteroid isomerase-like protein
MRTVNLISSFVFIIFMLLIACDKEQPRSDSDLDWLEYTGYIPLPGNDAVWVTEVTSEEIPENGPVATLYRTVTNRYYLNGDTSINNILYKKVFNKRIIFTQDYSDNTESLDTTILYAGGLRQNMPGKEVFFMFASDTDEKLLYEFNVAVGDSVHFYTTREQKGVISCKDSILIRNRYHDLYIVQEGSVVNSYSYIEGIGSSQGLIIESGGSLNGPWDITFITFAYKEIIMDINWDIIPKNFY